MSNRGRKPRENNSRDAVSPQSGSRIPEITISHRDLMFDKNAPLSLNADDVLTKNQKMPVW